jgi:hypothetical protein
MNCIGCHTVKDLPPVGSPGPRIDQFAQRLRYEWWRAYFQQPARFKPGTRMPSFALGRRSTVPGIAGGEIYAQGDALWSYFALGKDAPLPDGLAAAGTLDLVVGTEPLVLRSFLERSGSRAIAVGMPSGLHYGFDAEKVRLAEAWQGDFVDASNSWAGRGGTILKGQGTHLWSAPDAPPLLPIADGDLPATWPTGSGRDHGYRFRGYRMGTGGAPPVFLYDVGGVRVEERVSAVSAPKPRLVRAFEFGSAPGRLALNAGAGAVALANVLGFHAKRVNRDGAAWFDLVPRPDATSFRFELEVTP